MHKKWILRNILKTSAHWTVLAPTVLKTCIWPKEATSKTQSLKSFTGGPNASKPVSSFTAKTMRHIRHPPQKNVALLYPHKIDWRRLINVWYGSLMGSETLEIYIHIQFTDSLETVHRQTVIRGLWAQARQNIYVCLPVFLSVCESVYLPIKKVKIALGQWPV